MTTTDENSIPVGLYMLSILMLVPAFGALYAAINAEINIYFAVIIVPLFTYTGIGIISRWPKAKELYMVIAVLLFIGAIPDLVIEFLSEETIVMPNEIHITENIVQFAILPIAYFYFQREKVISYFEPAS